MRSQLFAGGAITALLGVLFYVSVLPLFFAWWSPLLVGGCVMCIASLFMAEGTGPVKASEGFRFCVYCSSQIPVTTARCPSCNGLQPREGE